MSSNRRSNFANINDRMNSLLSRMGTPSKQMAFKFALYRTALLKTVQKTTSVFEGWFQSKGEFQGLDRVIRGTCLLFTSWHIYRPNVTSTSMQLQRALTWCSWTSCFSYFKSLSEIRVRNETNIQDKLTLI